MTDLLESCPLPICRPLHCADDFVRREPTKAMMAALGAGFLLNVLPLGTIAASVTRIACASIRPTLLILGMIKACELCQNQKIIPDRHE
jgi:hypothetical protein